MTDYTGETNLGFYNQWLKKKVHVNGPFDETLFTKIIVIASDTKLKNKISSFSRVEKVLEQFPLQPAI